MEEEKSKKIIVYGHNYCAQALILARALKKNKVDHEWRDIMAGPPEWQDEVKAMARGNLSVPTVVFPDGKVMVEPRPEQVMQAVGIESTSIMELLRRRFRKE